ncbi:MAG: hypothetical protein SRB2_04116 [Desulfobacteraceae bacterium Eth-SRB2]|nr:MAG: hypothetical protein SRB2_04116 [Desulfobacteraceae bacterium Eth-SRB2]
MKKPFPGDKADMTLYSDLPADIKMRIRQAQNRAVMSANAEMIRMYWDGTLAVWLPNARADRTGVN